MHLFHHIPAEWCMISLNCTRLKKTPAVSFMFSQTSVFVLQGKGKDNHGQTESDTAYRFL